MTSIRCRNVAQVGAVNRAAWLSLDADLHPVMCLLSLFLPDN